MEKELNIIPPIGYEIDRQKSTFEKIIFKKIPENPKTWEEYCEMIRGNTLYYTNCDNRLALSGGSGAHNGFSTKERAKQFITLGKLLQLRDYWVGDWKIDSSSLPNTYLIYNNGFRETIVTKIYGENFPLTFPTKEMAKEFKDCFSDLIKQAYPLV